MDDLSGRISGSSSSSDDGRVLRSFDSAVRRAVVDLRRIEPPEEVVTLHRRLVGEIDQYGARVQREAGTLRTKDPARLVAAQQRLLSATKTVSREINATIDQINRRLSES
jgi:hypothetical protein